MASNPPRRPKLCGRAYNQGDHVCVAYETTGEQLAVAADYIGDGLARNERCLYTAPTREGLDMFCDALTATGTKARAAVRKGSLLLLTKERAHLPNGRFDPEAMLHMLSETVEQALNDGYRGLRTCGDMSWLLDKAPGSEQVGVYEALLNQFFASVRAMGMCQYDVTRLPKRFLKHALDTHPSIVAAGAHRANPYCGAQPRAGLGPSLADKLASLGIQGA